MSYPVPVKFYLNGKLVYSSRCNLGWSYYDGDFKKVLDTMRELDECFRANTDLLEKVLLSIHTFPSYPEGNWDEVVFNDKIRNIRGDYE